MKAAEKKTIAASENDLRNNRLGLMSAGQIDMLQTHIDLVQAQSTQVIKRCIGLAVLVTIGVVLLSFVRVLLLPIALATELVMVGIMVYLTSSVSRFAQQLSFDRESEAVRIIKGRTSRYAMRTHPFYNTLRVELETYKLLDASLAREFATGEPVPTVRPAAFRRGHRRGIDRRKRFPLPALDRSGSQCRKMRMLRALPWKRSIQPHFSNLSKWRMTPELDLKPCDAAISPKVGGNPCSPV